jgi:hypothetical protein
VRIKSAFIQQHWRDYNEEKQAIVEEILDLVAPLDREILKCLFGVKEYADLPRPSIRLTAKILGISRKVVSIRTAKVFSDLRQFYRLKLLQ